MRAICAGLAGVLLLVACAPVNQTAVKTQRSAAPTSSPLLALPSPTPDGTAPTSPATPASPSPSPPPSPVVACPNSNPEGHPVVLLGGRFGVQLIFDIADPFHPRLLCTLRGTGAHLVSAAQFEYLDPSASPARLIRRTIAGSEIVAGTIAAPVSAIFGAGLAWRTDGGYAYVKQLAQNSPNTCCGRQEDHVVFGGGDRAICAYDAPIVGMGPARFFPREVFGFSPDGGYFAAGTLFGKGGGICNVVVSPGDGAIVARLPEGYASGFWSASGHRLFLVGRSDVRAWSPDSPATFSLVTTDAWVDPQAAPGGRYVAYTYYAHPGTDGELRVGVFDLTAGRALAGLPDSPRSQASFVSPTVAWYLEEAACAPDCIWGQAPTGRVLAFDTATGREAAVDFGPTGSPITTVDFQAFGVVDTWPPG